MLSIQKAPLLVMDRAVGRIAARKVTSPPHLLGTSSYPPFQGSTNGATDLSESRGNDKKRRDHCRRLGRSHGLREPEIPSLSLQATAPTWAVPFFLEWRVMTLSLERPYVLIFDQATGKRSDTALRLQGDA